MFTSCVLNNLLTKIKDTYKNNKILSKKALEEIICFLKDELKNKIFITWEVEDIVHYALTSSLPTILTTNEVKNIMYSLEDVTDCEFGLTWTTIGAAIEDCERDEEGIKMTSSTTHKYLNYIYSGKTSKETPSRKQWIKKNNIIIVDNDVEENVPKVPSY